VDHIGRSSVIQLSYLYMKRADVDLAWLHVKHNGEDCVVVFTPATVKSRLLELGGVDGYSLDDSPRRILELTLRIRLDVMHILLLYFRRGLNPEA
jgi:hypothetical protein